MTWDDLYRDPRYTKRTPHPEVVKWLKTLPADSSIVDVGCGVGRHMDIMIERGFKTWGCDPSLVAMEAARINGDCVYLAPAQSMPFGHDVFDAALCFGVLQYLPEPELPAALLEISRVLKPGGELMLVTRSVSDDRNFGKIPEAETDMPMAFLTKIEVESLLRGAGFKGGRIGRMAIDWPGGYHDDDWVVFTRKAAAC